jgi:hypothetical protein
MLEPSDDFKWNHGHVVVEKPELKLASKHDIDRGPGYYMRMCDALQGLNKQCVIIRCGVPKEKFNNLRARKSKISSALDNAKGFFQRLIHKDLRCISRSLCRTKEEYNRYFFRSWYAPFEYQRMYGCMGKVTMVLKNTHGYIDNCLISTKDGVGHYECL